MTTLLFAQPYDICANGFYFSNVEDYETKAENLLNQYGQPVEEFEIQFIDGENIDAKLFTALGIHQGNLPSFFEIVEEWDNDDKVKVFLAVGECGYSFEVESDTPDQFDMDIYEMNSLKELAVDFVEQGLLGDIPDNIQRYLDYDAIAYDLGMDYSEATIDGTHYIYRLE
jgi:antirestriction protein